jgi:hypothetical protein
MDIFQSNCNGKTFRAVIISDRPIFVSYFEILKMAIGYGVDYNVLGPKIKSGEFPSPITFDTDYDEILENGIWMHDQVACFMSSLFYDQVLDLPLCHEDTSAKT